MNETKHPVWPRWSKIFVLVLVPIFIGLLIAILVPKFVELGEAGVALLHFLIACLALASAIAITIGESISGINTTSWQRKVRVGSWFKMVGYAALIASAGYLVGITYATYDAITSCSTEQNYSEGSGSGSGGAGAHSETGINASTSAC